MVEICERAGTPAQRIDSRDAIRPEWFAGVDRVGIIGGNDAHKSVIDEIETRIQELTG